MNYVEMLGMTVAFKLEIQDQEGEITVKFKAQNREYAATVRENNNKIRRWYSHILEIRSNFYNKDVEFNFKPDITMVKKEIRYFLLHDVLKVL